MTTPESAGNPIDKNALNDSALEQIAAGGGESPINDYSDDALVYQYRAAESNMMNASNALNRPLWENWNGRRVELAAEITKRGLELPNG